MRKKWYEPEPFVIVGAEPGYSQLFVDLFKRDKSFKVWSLPVVAFEIGPVSLIAKAVVAEGGYRECGAERGALRTPDGRYVHDSKVYPSEEAWLDVWLRSHGAEKFRNDSAPAPTAPSTQTKAPASAFDAADFRPTPSKGQKETGKTVPSPDPIDCLDHCSAIHSLTPFQRRTRSCASPRRSSR